MMQEFNLNFSKIKDRVSHVLQAQGRELEVAYRTRLTAALEFYSLACTVEPSLAFSSGSATWYLSVGASTINRKLRVTAVLGNNEEFNGESLYRPANGFPNHQQLPLVYTGSDYSNFEKYDVKGKIVLCELSRSADDQLIEAGAAGVIFINTKTEGYSIAVDSVTGLPATIVTHADGQKIINYATTAANATATIVYKGTVYEDANAPAVGYFSPRGPSIQSPGILKPDIIGPGVNILEAWPYSVEGIPGATATFNIISGTSMSCPHLSGVSALLKTAHPEWSPAMIKSAIMTTAYQTNLDNSLIEDETGGPAGVYAIGSGHVDPIKANDPGLVYDIQPDDYIPYLCGLYTSRQVTTIVSRKVDCRNFKAIPEAQLNYPSFSIELRTRSAPTKTVTRTVTYVGGAESESYRVEIGNPSGVQVAVEPSSLTFSQDNKQQKYTVSFTTLANSTRGETSGYLRWYSDKGHSVRSPIAVNVYLFGPESEGGVAAF